MIDRENVIEHLKKIVEYFRRCRSNASFASKAENHFWELQNAASQAAELLKEQEPAKPYIDYDGQDVWRCGSCGATLFHLSHTQADENEQNCVKFCRYCGQAVKWDEPQKEEK